MTGSQEDPHAAMSEIAKELEEKFVLPIVRALDRLLRRWPRFYKWLDRQDIPG